MPKHYEEKVSEKVIYTGKVFTVTKDDVTLQNGNPAFREVVHHNGGAGILAINEKNEIALVKQYRYAVGMETIEIPAGKIETGEPPIQTAIRELEEEAGCIAASVEDFGSILPTCAYCTEVIYLFLAKGLEFTKQNLDSDEFLSLIWLPFEKALEMVLNGEITDSKTVAAITKYKLLY